LDAAKIHGKLMGIPGNGGTPLVNAGLAFIYRDDLRQKYSLPMPDSLDNIDKYLAGIRESEPNLVPLSSSQIALALMPALGPESVLAGTEGSVAVSIGADSTASCEAVQDAASFKAAVAKAREWFTDGYVPKDIVGTDDSQSALTSGKAASTFGSALSLSQLQQAVSAADPNAALSCLPVIGSGAKYLEGYGGSALCVASGSRHGDSVVQFIDWVYTSQANYDLMSYGVPGKNYKLSGERLATQDGSYVGLPGTFFTNGNYMRFTQGVPDDAISAYRNWNLGAQMSPLAGFTLDGTNVSAELASVKIVYGIYAKLLLTGSTDEDALLAEFGTRLKAAGQDKIVVEAQAQVNAFLSGH
jgi:putative aldouronate transport system substrate-binding protein